MGDGEQRWAGVSIGISRYADRILGEVPPAADSAREVSKALESVGSMRVLTNVGASTDFFVALQQSIHEARGGSFFFYFAGIVLERSGELLLAVTGTEAEEKKGCVPWSDVEDILHREKVTNALVVLNAEKGASFASAAVAKGMKNPNLGVIGSLRTREPAKNGADAKAYSDVLVRALKGPLDDLTPYLSDRRLDGPGLSRFLKDKAPKGVTHEIIRPPRAGLVVRDVARELVDLEAIPVSMRKPSPSKVDVKEKTLSGVKPASSPVPVVKPPEPKIEEKPVVAAPPPAAEPVAPRPAPEPAPAVVAAPEPPPAPVAEAAPVPPPPEPPAPIAEAAPPPPAPEPPPPPAPPEPEVSAAPAEAPAPEPAPAIEPQKAADEPAPAPPSEPKPAPEVKLAPAPEPASEPKPKPEVKLAPAPRRPPVEPARRPSPFIYVLVALIAAGIAVAVYYFVSRGG